MQPLDIFWKKSFLKNSCSESCQVKFAVNYGYEFEGDKGLVVPQIVCQPKVLLDFPQLCTCLKCARANVCLCRMKDIPCYDFCKCRRECKYTIVIYKPINILWYNQNVKNDHF